MTIFTQLGLFLFELALIALVCVFFYEWGHKRGVESGDRDAYRRGRVDELNWWIGAETEVNQVREQMWRKEHKR